MLAHTLSVELCEIEDRQLLRRAFVIKRARVSDLALQEPEIHRIERELQTRLRRVRRRVDRTPSVERSVVDKKRTLKLNLAAQPAAIALASLIGLVPVEYVVGQNVRQKCAAQRSPRVN